MEYCSSRKMLLVFLIFSFLLKQILIIFVLSLQDLELPRMSNCIRHSLHKRHPFLHSPYPMVVPINLVPPVLLSRILPVALKTVRAHSSSIYIVALLPLTLSPQPHCPNGPCSDLCISISCFTVNSINNFLQAVVVPQPLAPQ